MPQGVWVTKRDFPKIHFYDQDFVDIYDKTWAWIQDCWNPGTEKGVIEGKFFSYPGSSVVQQTDAIFSSFFLVYSNRIYQAHPTLDLFYQCQEPNGAIRCAYTIETGLPALEKDNPEGLGIPLFAWAEFNLYHKSANKKRVKDVLPVLHRYTEWIAPPSKSRTACTVSPFRSRA
jgi:neutral trehalase